MSKHTPECNCNEALEAEYGQGLCFLHDAAPDMLEALKQALALCKAHGWHVEPDESKTETIVLRKVEAAIAKAKGEA